MVLHCLLFLAVIRAKVLEKIYEPVNGGPPIRVSSSRSQTASSRHPSPSSKVSQDTIDTQDTIKPSTSKPTTGTDILLGGSPRLRMAERPRQPRYREATADESSWNPWQYKLSYRVMVEKVYKGEERVKSKTKVKVVSPADSGICGMTKMDEKTRYLITGKMKKQ